MKVTSRIAHLGIVVGVTLVASNANAALRFYYAYGNDAQTLKIQQRNWGGTTPNAAAAAGAEIANGSTIAINKFADNVGIKLQLFVENTGSSTIFANTFSVFSAFAAGGVDDQPLWRERSGGNLGSQAAADPFMTMVKNGGTTLTNSTSANGSFERWIFDTGTNSWQQVLDPDTSAVLSSTFNNFREYAIQGSDESAPSAMGGGRYVGFSYNAGFPTSESIRLNAGAKVRLYDVVFKAGANSGLLNLNGDGSNEVGLRLLAGGVNPGSGTYLGGLQDITGATISTTFEGANYRLLTTPEPGTYAALALGAAAVMRRRKKA